MSSTMTIILTGEEATLLRDLLRPLAYPPRTTELSNEGIYLREKLRPLYNDLREILSIDLSKSFVEVGGRA